MPWVDVSFEGPVSHFEIEILPIFPIWNRKGSWNVHFLPGEYLEYLACERLNSSYILIRASDWSWVEGNSKQSNNQKYLHGYHYGICALVPLHFAGKSYSGISKCRPISAKFMHLVRLMWSSGFESPPVCPQSFSRLSRSNFECWLRRRRRLIHMKLICTEFDSVYVKYGFWTRRKVISMFYGNRSDFL